MIKISGTVERIVYTNPENGYTVFRARMASFGDLVTFVATQQGISVGQTFQTEGDWVTDPRFGRQFSSKQIKIENPQTKEGLVKYLASGAIPGIGESYAKKIVDEFGIKALDVLRDEPEKLRAIAGLGTKRAAKASRGVREQGAMAELQSFLQGYGLGPALAQKLLRQWGVEVVQTIKKNPYALVGEVEGLGFARADEMALKMGFKSDSLQRSVAAFEYILKKIQHEGHLYLPKDDLFAEAEKLLEHNNNFSQILMELSEQKKIVCEAERVYHPLLYALETECATRLKAIMAKPCKAIEGETILDSLQSRESLKLSDSQKKALLEIVNEKVSILTGGPGTGKSTITRFLVKMFQAKGLRISLCAPTGRAAQRLEECTSHEASTIHRLLKFDPIKKSFTHNQNDPLECDVLICDESSMIDVPLAVYLLRAIPPGARIVFVGDADQLPPVGAGSFFLDLIQSDVFQVEHLKDIFRQAENSGIIQAAYAINNGQKLEADKLGEDFFFIAEEDPKTLQEKVVELISKRIPEKFSLDPVTEIQVLSPMYRGGLGINQLNTEIQRALNPDPRIKINRGEKIWGLGDRIVVLKNNYEKEVFNGDLGIIRKMDLELEEIEVEFDRGHRVVFESDYWDDLDLSYALSIHKSQGSEFPCVILPLSTQHFVMLRRKLLYTAVTRAKKLCIIVGSRRAFQIAVSNFQEAPRFTALKERLRST